MVSMLRQRYGLLVCWWLQLKAPNWVNGLSLIDKVFSTPVLLKRPKKAVQRYKGTV
jgi:hypothetical protein